jgi:RNA polymerase sigma-70 factor (ECF subfamily)
MTGTKLRQQEAFLAEAMRLAQDGDAHAYRELLESTRAILQVYVRRVLGRMGLADPGEVEDRVQEILLALHDKRHTYDPRRPFLPWLFAISRYKLIDYGRGRRRAPRSVPVESVEDMLEAPVFAEPGAAHELAALLGALTPRAREALELVKIEGLSVAEAAARTRMSESALKVTVHRALKHLRAKWGSERRR